MEKIACRSAAVQGRMVVVITSARYHRAESICDGGPMPLLLSLVLALAPQPAIKVMVVGVFHMSNPGHEIHNLKVDDVLAPARQHEIETVTSAMAKLRPTRVAAEWPAELTAERY